MQSSCCPVMRTAAIKHHCSLTNKVEDIASASLGRCFRQKICLAVRRKATKVNGSPQEMTDIYNHHNFLDKTKKMQHHRISEGEKMPNSFHDGKPNHAETLLRVFVLISQMGTMNSAR